jgi:hypothetical protein
LRYSNHDLRYSKFAISVLERTVEALRQAHAGGRAALQAQVEARVAESEAEVPLHEL